MNVYIEINKTTLRERMIQCFIENSIPTRVKWNLRIYIYHRIAPIWEHTQEKKKFRVKQWLCPWRDYFDVVAVLFYRLVFNKISFTLLDLDNNNMFKCIKFVVLFCISCCYRFIFEWDTCQMMFNRMTSRCKMGGFFWRQIVWIWTFDVF